ncbi:aspartate/glutamate racemase family protein [Pseudonocardia sp. C8]|uniref:glutamate racemase n=1 Tax=Pseudonocardia sp. C8 TaxID=2762759 RepID=UPI00164263D9|nr:aspartate/glutamate racemase family protein [Pseudonocardia sp. C8]MBC3191087.1 aspartate/glutamate racemase family protein [Pseudonocardia sp. C8]
MATIGVFDAGIGGLPLASILRHRAPQHSLVYLGDAARRPYGPRPAAEVTQYVAEAEQFFADAGCDVWAVACNTASVVLEDQPARLIPRVDMLMANRAAADTAPAGTIGVLATAGTVASGAVGRAISDRDVRELATEDLLRLAEIDGGDDPRRLQTLVDEAVAILRGWHCTSILLACTDFTCVLDLITAASDGIAVIDPLGAAADLVLDTAARVAAHAGPGRGDRLYLTGPHEVDIRQLARDTYGLDLPPVDYATLPTVGAV